MLTPIPQSIESAQTALRMHTSWANDQSSGSTSGVEARMQGLMLQLYSDSLQAQEVGRNRQTHLLHAQIAVMQQLAGSARWDGIRSLAFGVASGITSCAAPFARTSFQQPLQAIGSNVMPQIGRCWDSFAESSKMPKQLERSHLDHFVQINQNWLHQLQGQEQRIQELFRSCMTTVRS